MPQVSVGPCNHRAQRSLRRARLSRNRSPMTDRQFLMVLLAGATFTTLFMLLLIHRWRS